MCECVRKRAKKGNDALGLEESVFLCFRICPWFFEPTCNCDLFRLKYRTQIKYESEARWFNLGEKSKPRAHGIIVCLSLTFIYIYFKIKEIVKQDKDKDI